jgi:hypothetical protein
MRQSSFDRWATTDPRDNEQAEFEHEELQRERQGITFVLYRDGVELFRTNDDLDILRYLHETHGYSMDHAIKHEGYKVEEVNA